MQASQLQPNDSASPTNGQSALHDLFALTDEQILEIEPEAQDAAVTRDPLPVTREETRVGQDRASTALEPNRLRNGVAGEKLNSDSQTIANSSSTVHGTQNTEHAPEPPAWLAAQMKDPWSGEEARDLWNGIQQARQEAAAYREVFAKPEDARALKEIYPGGVNEARAAAERARQLNEIDQAYFKGDTAQRSQLAAMMLREDPAAFREMVFAGLRALEQAGQGAEDKTVAAVSGPAGIQTTDFRPRAVSDSESINQRASRPDQKTPPSEEGGYMASYPAFEKAANEQLERSVGGAIERTLAQALPAAARTDGAALGGRLSAAIHQDIEKTLRGDRQLGEQVAQILSGRRLDEEARGQVVRLIGERAQQLLPGAAKRVINEWTQATFAAHRARPNQSRSVADRPDLAPARGAAPNPSLRSGNASRNSDRNDSGGGRGNRLDYRKLSDEQILEM